MHPKPPRLVFNLRYQSREQIERFKRCAKLKRWSLNTFLLVAAEAAAEATEEEAKGKMQLIKWGLNESDSHL